MIGDAEDYDVIILEYFTRGRREGFTSTGSYRYLVGMIGRGTVGGTGRGALSTFNIQQFPRGGLTFYDFPLDPTLSF